MLANELAGFRRLAFSLSRDLLRTPLTMISMSSVFVIFLLVYLMLQWSIDAQGGGPDMIGANLGVLLMAGFSAIALVGTAVPIVAMRERGTLRVFATTPLHRLTFFLALLPVRILLAAAQIVVVLAIAALRSGVAPTAILRLLITAAIGLAMLLAVSLLVASRARSAEATQQSMAMLSILLIFASGGLLPEEIVPATVTAAMRALPTTWFADAVRADVVGYTPFVPVPWLWVGMLVIAAASLVWAVRRFDWDGRRWAPPSTGPHSATPTREGARDGQR